MGGRDSTGNQGLILKTCECLTLPLSPKAIPTATIAAAAATTAADAVAAATPAADGPRAATAAATPAPTEAASHGSVSSASSGVQAPEEGGVVVPPCQTPRGSRTPSGGGGLLSPRGGSRPSLQGPMGPWGPLPPMRQARCRFAAIHIRGKVFCVGEHK